MESSFRRKLARMPATKLFIKSAFDLYKLDFYQFKNSLKGAWETSKCNMDCLFNNKKTVECNICGWQGNRFYPHVNVATVAADEKCPVCGSIPYYRYLFYYWENNTDIYNKDKKILEIGPNRSSHKKFIDEKHLDYISVDLKSPQAMYHMNIKDLKFPDEQFDFVICISVLHFVDDDQKGLEEIFRVLKPGGVLFIGRGINIELEQTIEHKPTVENCYILRTYGRDIKDKMHEIGFTEIGLSLSSELSEEIRKKYGIGNHSLYIARK